MNLNKIYRLLPFAILLVITVITWTEILTAGHIPRIRNLVGAGLVLINIIVYIFSLRIGVLLTGVTLVLATLNVAAFTNTIVTNQFWIGPLAFPVFQPLALLLLVIFGILNFRYLSQSFRKSVS